MVHKQMVQFSQMPVSTGTCTQSKWTKGSVHTKIIGTYKSEMPGNSAGNYVTLHEFQYSHL